MANCLKCSDAITAIPDAVKCAIASCGNIFHMKCVGLSRSTLNIISNSNNVKFICDGCLDSVLLSSKVTPPPIDNFAEELADIKLSITNLSSMWAKASTSWPTLAEKSDNKTKRSRYDMDLDENVFTPAPPQPVANMNENVIVGSADVTGLRTVEPRKLIVASMLDPATSSDALVNFLNEKLKLPSGSTIARVTKLVPAGIDVNKLDFISFKISVPSTHYNSLMSADMWPKGVTVREFQQRPRKIRTVGFLPNQRRDLSTNRPISSPHTSRDG